MKNLFLVSNRICLHALTEQDLKEDSPYYSWLNDLSLDTYTERSLFSYSLSDIRKYYDAACAHNTLILLGIYDNSTGYHIGNITFQDINWIQQRAFIAYLLGSKEHTGKGIVTEAVLMMMYYGFQKLNFEKIMGGVAEDHIASRRICEKTGLKIEGQMREHIKRNGKRIDVYVVGSLRKEWLESFGEKTRSLFTTLF